MSFCFSRIKRRILVAAAIVAAPLVACTGSATGLGDTNPREEAPDAVAPPTCAEAAAAVCNAPAQCGGTTMSLQSCMVAMEWLSTETCIAVLTANCGPDASATPQSPSIADPAACLKAQPFTCGHGQAVIPASCVTCVQPSVDAG